MGFVERSALPSLQSCVGVLRSSAHILEKQTVITDMINAVMRRGLVTAPEMETASDMPAVDRARELLTSSIKVPPSLQELADAVGSNRFVLLREFRKKFGLPPHAFVLRLRVDRARSLLARGEPITGVAQLLGFADQSHLSRVFKRVVGLSPGAYQRQARSFVDKSISFTTHRRMS